MGEIAIVMVATGSIVVGKFTLIPIDLGAAGSVELFQVRDESRAFVLSTGFRSSFSYVERWARGSLGRLNRR